MSDSQQRFKDANDVLTIVSDIELASLIRCQDRAAIDRQFNGDRPFTYEQERQQQIQINTNFLEGFNIGKDAISQTNTALLYKDRLAELRCIQGDVNRRSEWSERATANFNRPLQTGVSGRQFSERINNRNTSLTMHGIGPLWWSHPDDWMPFYISLDDLLIPTDTPIEMSEELGYFGVNSWLTPLRLYRMVRGPKANPGWNERMVSYILRQLNSIKQWTPDYWDFWMNPEKTESLWKQHALYLNSDSVPKIKITNFYHQDTETGKWFRKVIVRENQQISVPDTQNEFLYVDDKPFADSLAQLLHIQFGDTSVVAPKKYHSVRGLGVPLYTPVELQNRLRCQFAEHVFQNLTPLISLDNPIDQGRPMMLRYQQYGVLQKGVRFVRNDERHQIDPRLVMAQMDQLRQILSENSASYVQDIDTGTQKAQTLGEAQIRLQSANRMISSMLQANYKQEPYLYREIFRRMIQPGTTNAQALEFQRRCKADGIPSELMNMDAWEITITKPYGTGDQTLAQQEVASLMGIYPRLEPTAQRKVMRDYIAVIGRNPDRAMDLIPEEPNKVSSGRKAAEDVFATLMLGVPVGLREGIEQRDYIEAMLGMLSQKIQQVEAVDNVGDTETVIGMSTVLSDIEQHIALMEQDRDQKEFTTAAGKALGVLTNKVKGFAQRVAEKEKANDPQDPEKIAQAQATMMKTEADLKAKEAKSIQALEQKEAKFQQQMEQDRIKFQTQIRQQQEEARLQMELAVQKAVSEAMIRRQQEAQTTEAPPQNS